ncbi:hypothetical protein DFH06DRAFT_629817 [Mycena polygramma]|nr:hypothetical protein DFH06DRAFT_629817 [Mycena polygramma]
MSSTVANRGAKHCTGPACPTGSPAASSPPSTTRTAAQAQLLELATHAGGVAAAFVPRNRLWRKSRARSAAPPDGTGYFGVAITLQGSSLVARYAAAPPPLSTISRRPGQMGPSTPLRSPRARDRQRHGRGQVRGRERKWGHGATAGMRRVNGLAGIGRGRDIGARAAQKNAYKGTGGNVRSFSNVNAPNTVNVVLPPVHPDICRPLACLGP